MSGLGVEEGSGGPRRPRDAHLDSEGSGKVEREYSPLLPAEPAVGAPVLAGYIRNHRGRREQVALGARRVVPGGREPPPRGVWGTNLGMLRHVALSLLKPAGTKGSIQTRRMKAARGDAYLLKVLQGIEANEVRVPGQSRDLRVAIGSQMDARRGQNLPTSDYSFRMCRRWFSPRTTKWSRHSWRRLWTHRSAYAFRFGATGPTRFTSVPSASNTASNSRVNFAS
jgi:hypothetical protein